MTNRGKNGLRAKALLIAGCLSATIPHIANAQLFLAETNFVKGPIDGSDPLVGLPVPGANPTELRAHLVWNMRAGLNVAALQCQFSPYLRAVDNYNSILATHNKELADTYSTLTNYFKRVHGAQGQKRFDDYTTITYNNFSTLQAQYGFCQTASNIAKEALTRPKGQLYVTAQERMRELRSSLVPVYPRAAIYNPYLIRMPIVPPLQDSCWDRKGNLRAKCVTATYG